MFCRSNQIKYVNTFFFFLIILFINVKSRAKELYCFKIRFLQIEELKIL